LPWICPGTAGGTGLALASAVNVAKTQSGAREVILVGHSLGAKVIREAYRQSDADVVGSVLVEGSLHVGDRDALLKQARDSVDSAGFSAFTQRLFGDMFLKGSDLRLRQRLLARAQKLDPKFGRELFLESVGSDTVSGTERLKQIAVPVLLLQAISFNSEFKRQPLHPGMTTPFMEMVQTSSQIPRPRSSRGADIFR
jgi:pimeloyl-ACP methyl ester carboxylesterase